VSRKVGVNRVLVIFDYAPSSWPGSDLLCLGGIDNVANRQTEIGVNTFLTVRPMEEKIENVRSANRTIKGHAQITI
jgi:hypothetical protein